MEEKKKASGMTPSPSYEIRAHHGMCLTYFQGKGYSDTFSKHMGEVKQLLDTNPLIRVTGEADAICSGCPNNQEGVCTSSETVVEYDRQVLLRCGLSEGDVMPFREFEKKVYDSILLPGKREEICGDCGWNALCYFENGKKGKQR